MGVTLVELSKAIDSLEEVLSLFKKSAIGSAESKAFRDSSIQRFEYCIELSWKTSIKLMGSTTTSSKMAVREMARNNLLQNPELWLEFIDARNNTSHSYDEEIAAKVFVKINEFLPEAKQLFLKLEEVSRKISNA